MGNNFNNIVETFGVGNMKKIFIPYTKERNGKFIKITTTLVMQSKIQTFIPLLELPPTVNLAIDETAT
jgi:lipid II:glycine glycyltransferase (peptidoglycan interpeptide bridge formation enzyme)